MAKPSGTVCFVLSTGEMRADKSELIKKSDYFSNLLQASSRYSEVRILLPEWVSESCFEIFLNFLSTNELARIDIITAQKLLWIADFFQDVHLQEVLIENFILTQINHESVLLFLQDAYTRTEKPDPPECWKKLFRQALHAASENADSIFSRFPDAVKNLDKHVVELLIRKALEMNPRIMLENAEQLMSSFKSCTGSFNFQEVLENEVVRSKAKYRSELKIPIIEWEAQYTGSGNFYSESDVFYIGGKAFNISLTSFEHEKKLDMVLQYADGDIPSENDDYISISYLFQITLPGSTYSKNDVTVISLPNFTPINLGSINPFDTSNPQNLKITLFGYEETIISSLAFYFTENVQSIMHKEPVDRLCLNLFKSVLSSNLLNVSEEDLVLEAVAKWYSSQREEANLKSLFELVRWNYIETEGLLRILCNYPKLRESPIYIEVFRNEIMNKSRQAKTINLMRRNSYIEPSITVEPRYSYKQKLADSNPSYTRKVLGTLADFILTQHSKPAPDTSEDHLKFKNLLEEKDREIAELKYQLECYKAGSDTTKPLSPMNQSYRSGNKSMFEDNWPVSEIKERPSIISQGSFSNISLDRGRSNSIDRFLKDPKRVSKSPARQLLDKLLTKIDQRLPQTKDRRDELSGFRPPLTPIKKNAS